MKKAAILLFVLALSGCSSNQVLIEDGRFDQTFLYSINSSPEHDKVIFKSYSMDYGDWGGIHENFVITTGGVFVVDWSRGHERFITKFKMPFDDIKNVSYVPQKEALLGLGKYPGLIQITDKDNKIHSFMIVNNSAEFAERIIKHKINNQA